MNSHKGFTIIELIVVIAVIAVLSTIVLANVTDYIGKGKDAAIKEQAKQVQTAATDFFSTNNTYTGVCGTGTQCNKAVVNVTKLGGRTSTPQNNDSAYCMYFTLSDGTSKWCIDSTGYAGSTNNCASLHYSCN